MTAHWKFNTVRPGDRTRESQVEKFFNSENDRATSLIREGIQNSLDADPDDRMIRVRITLGQWSPDQTRELWERYADELIPHLESLGDKLPDCPTRSDGLRYLAFEDFETSGLCGDPAQWQIIENQKPPNGFFGFFRAEGFSNKEGSSRGRHGVGKFVFMAASRIRTIFGLTIPASGPAEGRAMLMGTTVLHYHHLGSDHFMPDGWYGIEDPNEAHNVLPLEEPTALRRFKTDFRLSRKSETGLSIVVPWLDANVKRDDLIRAVVEGYFFPIMENGLIVEIVDEADAVTLIDRDTLRNVVAGQGEEYVKRVTPRLDLAAAAIAQHSPVHLMPPGEAHSPSWSEACFTEEALHAIRAKLGNGELVAIHCPTRVTLKKDRETQRCHFTLYLQKDLQSSDYDVHFIRQGILVSEVRSKRIPGLRGLVVVRDGPLATFLGDAENPAHTEWQSMRVSHYSWNKASIDYVTTSIEQILRRVQDEENAPDPLPLKDLFFLPSEEDETKTKQKKPKQKPKAGGEPDVVPDLPKPPAKSYSVSKVDGGFTVRPGKGPRPESLEIHTAYDTHKGNPFKKYHIADFQLEKGGITVESVGVNIKEYDSNRLSVDVLMDDFEITVTGFDKNRDIIVKTKARTAGASEEDDDAETV
jgi:hypothetical protein